MVLTLREPRQPERSNRAGSFLPIMLFTALLLVPQAAGFASTYAHATLQEDPETIRHQQEELESIRQDIAVLSDNLNLALESIELGRERVDDIRRDLKQIEMDLEELGDVPGSHSLRASISELRRLTMDSYLRRSMGEALDIREMMDPGMWRELALEGAPGRGTSTRRDIFMIGEDVEVGLYQKVIGDVVVIGGKIVVHGSVTGSVISIFGDVQVTSTGRVDGDAVTIGGQIYQDAGGTIRGSFVDTHGFIPNRFFLGGIHGGTLFAISLAAFLFILILAIVTGLIVPKNVERVELQVHSRFGVSFLVGFATEILLPVAFLLLLITVIGIPVALLFLPMALMALFLLGFTGVAKAVGQGASKRGLRIGNSPLALISVGVVLIEAVYLAGRAIGIPGDIILPISFATRLIGALILYVAWTTGLGAALLTRFGTRTPGESVASPPKEAPPPVGAEFAG
ncbi:hypothetical protein ACFL6T_03585 [Candidatus Zixiibacteriota bacterium]